MLFKLYSISIDTTAKSVSVVENNEVVANFNNVVDTTAFTNLVQLRVLNYQELNFNKIITSIADKMFSGELPSAEDKLKAEGAKLAIAEIAKVKNELVKNTPSVENGLVNILAAELLKKPYALPVAKIDKLLRDYHASLVDHTDKITIDGASQQKIITAIKQAVKESLAVYNTEKDTIFKKWSLNLSNRDIVNLCSWFYEDITRNSETGIYNGKYKTDTKNKRDTNYAPLQSYLHKLVFMRLQHNN